MILLAEIFDVAADAYEAGDKRFAEILAQAGDAACWYWIIGPERGRPKAVPMFRNRTITVGLRGASFLEAGFVYAPYIPVINIPVAYVEGIATGSLITRYANRVIRNDYWGTIMISGSVV